jgi:hypothetical protein
VVLVRRSGVPPARAREILKQLTDELQAEKVELLPAAELERRLKQLGVNDPSFCNGKPECVRELGSQLEVPTLITLSLVLVKPDLSLSLQAFTVATDARLVEQSAVLPADAKGSDAPIATFVQSLAAVLKPSAPAVSDAPVKTPVLEPPPPTPPPVLAVQETPKRSVVPAVVTLAGAIAAAGAAAGLSIDAAIAGGQLRGTEANGVRTSELTEVQGNQLATRANVELGAAIGSGVVAVGLGILTVVLWPPASN